MQIVDSGLDIKSCFWNSTEPGHYAIAVASNYSSSFIDPYTNIPYSVTYDFAYNNTVHQTYYNKIVDYIAFADNGNKFQDPSGRGSKLAGEWPKNVARSLQHF